MPRGMDGCGPTATGPDCNSIRGVGLTARAAALQACDSAREVRLPGSNDCATPILPSELTGSDMTDFAARRVTMVDTQVRVADVTKFPILDAMLSVPRELFVPGALREAAYLGENLPIGDRRVMLEPRTLGKMLDALDVGPGDLVLDLACGGGYSTAVLARLAQAVVGVEEDTALAADAQEALAEVGADNAAVVAAPLAIGAPSHGPYDAIMVQGAVHDLPRAIGDQLREGGRIACLFMEGALGVVCIGRKIDGHIGWRYAFNASAPVLPGFERKAEFVF